MERETISKFVENLEFLDSFVEQDGSIRGEGDENEKLIVIHLTDSWNGLHSFQSLEELSQSAQKELAQEDEDEDENEAELQNDEFWIGGRPKMGIG